ncbi:Uncharacterised protein [Enterobacter hormaechei]|nr:Uncharacterised protein [Enterobacter hormaechei]SAC59031.1 Uncharacterised protein [Enterobacter hormaechei]
MNKVTHAPGDGPFTQTARGAHVGEIKGFLGTPRGGKTGAVPQRIDTGEHHLGLRGDQLRQIGMDKFSAHFLQELTHRLIATSGPHADAFVAQKLDRISA